ANRGVIVGNPATGGAGTFDVTNGNTLTYGGTIIDSSGSGTGGLVKTDFGTLVLTGTNTYSGGTTIAGGVLSVSSDANLGAVPASPTPELVAIDNATLQPTATFALNANRGVTLTRTSGVGGGTIDVTAGNTLTYNGVIADGGGGVTNNASLTKT